MTDLFKNKWANEPDNTADGSFAMTNDGLIPVAKSIYENRWNTPAVDTSTKYAIKVNGVIVSPKFPSQQSAMTFLSGLPESTQLVAEMVIVDSTGKEILLG